MVLFFILSLIFACIWLLRVIFSAWFLIFFFLYKAEKISFLVCMCDWVCVWVCVCELWCCGFCTFMLFLIKRGQMNASFRSANADENQAQSQKHFYWNDFVKLALLCFWFLFCVSLHYQWSSSRRLHYFCF